MRPLLLSSAARALRSAARCAGAAAAPALNAQRRAFNMLLLGPPGSGKGTQAQNLERDVGVVAYSTGNLLREQIASGSEVGRRAEDFMKQGRLIPDDVMFGVLRKYLVAPLAVGWLLDGFPRTVRQAELLDELLEAHNKRIALTLNLHASMDEVLMRLAGRLVHLASGRTYHPKFNPPKVAGKDDVTGEALIVRDDDREETIRKRMEVYYAETEPLVEYYSKRGTLRRIVVDGGYPHTVWADILQVLRPLLQ